MSDPNQDASDVRSIGTATSCWYDGIKTPLSSDFENLTQVDYVPSVPCPGKTYKIYLKDTDKAITLTEGKLLLQSPATPSLGCSWHWACVEHGNWLGFRNQVSGNFLGHNGRQGMYSGIHAKEAYQSACESFCVRHHPHGGYVLLVKHPRSEHLLQICSDGKRLVPKEKDGDQWIFEEVYMSVRS